MSEHLSNLCTTTTCHGIADLYGAKSVGFRVFWAIVIAAAFGAIGYYQYNLVLTYMGNPTATKISKMIVNELDFPNITVCNRNAYSMTKWNAQYTTTKQILTSNSVSLSNSTELLNWLRYATLTEPNIDPPHSSNAEKAYQVLFNASYPSNGAKYDYVQFMSSIGSSCDDMLEECFFTMTNFPCCHLYGSTLTQFGVCYEIMPNHNDTATAWTLQPMPHIQQQSGINAGVELTFKYDSTDIPFYSNSPITQGFYVSIGHHMSIYDKVAVTVGPGMFVSVDLALSKYKYDPSVTPCTEDVMPLSYTRSGLKSVSLCQQECRVKMNIQYCGCSPVYPNIQLSPTNICSPQKSADCFFGSAAALNSSYRSAVQQCEKQNCPKLCSTNVLVPFAVYSNVVSGGLNAQFKKSVVNIFFGEIAYTLIVETSLMDLSGLISGFGGNLGLFAGMSLITIVQCFAAFACAFHDGVIKKGKSKIQQSANKPADVEPPRLTKEPQVFLYEEKGLETMGRPISY